MVVLVCLVSWLIRVMVSVLMLKKGVNMLLLVFGCWLGRMLVVLLFLSILNSWCMVGFLVCICCMLLLLCISCRKVLFIVLLGVL